MAKSERSTDLASDCSRRSTELIFHKFNLIKWYTREHNKQFLGRLFWLKKQAGEVTLNRDTQLHFLFSQ